MHIIYDTTQVTSPQNGSNPQPGDSCHPLVKNGHVPLLVDVIEQPIVLDDQGGNVMNVSQSHQHEPIIATDVMVRRLTPCECGRLQGFPDGYLEQVKGYSDSKAYSAFGNSMTVQVMAWIGGRIDKVDKLMKQIDGKAK